MGKAKKAAQRYFSNVKKQRNEEAHAKKLQQKVRNSKAPEMTLIQFEKPRRNTL